MKCEILNQDTEDGKTYIDFKATPTRYYDSYKIYEIGYSENGETKQKETSVKIDAVFYKELYTFEDWQSIEEGTYQNYRLMQDIDFTGKENIKKDVTIGRLEAEGNKKTLKNIKISTDKSDTGLIKSVQNSMKNIIFENIEITNTATITNIGVISTTGATYENIEFIDIRIQAPNATNVGVIGNMSYGNIQGIILKDIEITGKNYVGSFIGTTAVTGISNITANNITVTGNDYVGGIFGYKPYEYYKDGSYLIGGITADNITVTGRDRVGGILGFGVCHNITLTNSNITGRDRVGGITGQTESCWDREDMVDLKLENNTIQGSREYIGGVAGYTKYINSSCKNTEIIKCNIIGTTVNSNYVGGICGYTQSHLENVSVKDSIISTKGSYVGGMIGIWNDRCCN